MSSTSKKSTAKHPFLIRTPLTLSGDLREELIEQSKPKPQQSRHHHHPLEPNNAPHVLLFYQQIPPSKRERLLLLS